MTPALLVRTALSTRLCLKKRVLLNQIFYEVAKLLEKNNNEGPPQNVIVADLKSERSKKFE